MSTADEAQPSASRELVVYYRCQHVVGRWVIGKDSHLQFMHSVTLLNVNCRGCRKGKSL